MTWEKWNDSGAGQSSRDPISSETWAPLIMNGSKRKLRAIVKSSSVIEILAPRVTMQIICAGRQWRRGNASYYSIACVHGPRLYSCRTSTCVYQSRSIRWIPRAKIHNAHSSIGNCFSTTARVASISIDTLSIPMYLRSSAISKCVVHVFMIIQW
jgi:hypothetical protein